jgi:protein-L-isoaspartate(D-aspartate) O-methyltransferase
MHWVRGMFADGRSPRDPREALIARLRSDPSLSPAAIEAIGAVPREEFVPPDYRSLAYEDAALEIGPLATISAPSMVAAMLTVMDLRPGMKVLEIGAGSGYAAATVAAMEASVIGLELQPELAESARRNLELAGFADRVQVVAADGAQGWAAEAPYNRILVSAAIDAVPQDWMAQVVVGGMIVYPEAGVGEDVLIRLTRLEDGWRRQEMGRCRFVRMQLGGRRPDVADYE